VNDNIAKKKKAIDVLKISSAIGMNNVDENWKILASVIREKKNVELTQNY